MDYEENKSLNTGCFPVIAGDRIGLYLEKPGSIAYTYTTDMLYGFRILNLPDVNYEDVFIIDQILPFKVFVFPYQFQITAYVGKFNITT